MKITNNILVLALVAVAMVFASCSKDNNDPAGPTQQEIEKNVVGKWKSFVENGKDVLTNNREVFTYKSDGTESYTCTRHFTATEDFFWGTMDGIKWSVKGNDFFHDMEDLGLKYAVKVYAVDNDKLDMEFYKRWKDGVETPYANERVISKRITVDYSKDIIGMWEGVEMTGYETYGNIEARIEYKADGTYTYYKKVNGAWQALTDVIDEWSVDGDWLATRWQNLGSDVVNYEWWDIDYIKDGVMKWSALREKEDGTRFNTTFTWKKMQRPTDQEIKKNIVGKWKATTLDGKPMVTEERDIITFNADGTETYTASRLDVELDDFVWSNKSSYKYSISNGILTETSADGRIRFDADVLLADGDVLVVDYTDTWKDDKKSDTPNTRVVFKKVAADYTNDVIGLWECDAFKYAIDGTTEKIRIEFNANGTYKYYKYVDGTWKQPNDTNNDYAIDGDWITVRFSTDNMNSFTIEAWDIDEVKTDTMKWSRLYKKEDGKLSTTTVEWKKVKFTNNKNGK